MGRARPTVGAVAAGLAFLALASPAAAHVGGLSDAGISAPVPTWLTVRTGGVVDGVSYLLTSVVTDRSIIRGANGASLPLPAATGVRRAGRHLLQGIGLLALPFVVVVGLTGPSAPTSNAAILLVWGAWWAGYTMTVYLVGNTWPAVDPLRTIAGALPSLDRSYPERLGAWPAVAGLLAVVYVEVVMPVTEDPPFLATLVIAYAVLTLAGAVVYGRETWFGTVDPVARVFRSYGRIAPIQRDESGRLAFRLPSGAIADDPESLDRGATAFVVALLWVTTYDGLVATPAWEALAAPIVAVGVPPLVLYLIALLLGFGGALAMYRVAARAARSTAGTFVTGEFTSGWFAPALLPIAAGYHVAHFLGFFVSILPAIAAVLGSPLDPPSVVSVIVVPDWFATVKLGFVLLGHLLAVWIAHALAFELFPGKLTPLRSQYPLVVAMIAYTMASAWIVSQPYGSPPFL
jgi:hypothetical protein